MKIEFIKDYSNKKKGNVHEFELSLAKRLIGEGVAKEYKKKQVKPKNKK